MSPYSDYLVFVDESGDHSLESINPEYPVFVLLFCIMSKAVYIETLVPAMKKLKLGYFGHDGVILHEHDIRKKSGPFARFGKEERERFLEELTALMEATEFQIVAVAIDKNELKRRYAEPAHPYHLAMQFGLERLYFFTKSRGEDERGVHVLCEARGAKEDRQLELEFRRICDGANGTAARLPFEVVILDKKANCEGLQMADLMARPVGLSILRPGQPNRAMQALETKFYCDARGRKDGYGLKRFP